MSRNSFTQFVEADSTTIDYNPLDYIHFCEICGLIYTVSERQFGDHIRIHQTAPNLPADLFQLLPEPAITLKNTEQLLEIYDLLEVGMVNTRAVGLVRDILTEPNIQILHFQAWHDEESGSECYKIIFKTN